MIISVKKRFVWNVVIRLNIKKEGCRFVMSKRNKERAKNDYYKNDSTSDNKRDIEFTPEKILHIYSRI